MSMESAKIWIPQKRIKGHAGRKVTRICLTENRTISWGISKKKYLVND